MKRLTQTFEENGGKFACLPECKNGCIYGLSRLQSGCRCHNFAKILDRLSAIEDILGDDYDLDRLRELVELTKNIPHVCRFCVGCEMEPKDGHGCDEYDSFVFSTRRLRELMEADRDGRCVVLPKPIGSSVYRIEYVESSDGWFEIGIKEHRFDFLFFAFERKNIGKTVFFDRESAEAALKGEQNGTKI